MWTELVLTVIGLHHGVGGVCPNRDSSLEFCANSKIIVNIKPKYFLTVHL